MKPTLNKQQEKELQKLKESHKNNFNRREQISTCASLLEFLRDSILKEEGGALSKADGTRSIANGREKKALIKNLIRVSSESVDHLNTVDFVTVQALNKRIRTGQTETGFSHEHMVPGEVIFGRLLPRSGRTPVITPLLEKLSYRALITSEERPELDGKGRFLSRLPDLPKRFPLDFYPFARYEAARIFLKNMVPVSERAERLMERYTGERSKLPDIKRIWGV